MACCICYQKDLILNLKCNHQICLSCLTKIRKLKCPYCRNSLDYLPDKIKSIISNSEEEFEIEESEPVLFGGGGLGPYWDAPGSNYFELEQEIKDLLDIIKEIDPSFWRHIRADVNLNNNSNYYSKNFLQNYINSRRNNNT